MSKTYTPGEQLEVEVVKIIPNGLGLSFAEKLTVFVPLSAPGDLLRVELADIRGRTAFARIVEVLRPGPGRREPPCEYYGDCGGCDFQHLDRETQLDAKVGIVRDCLKRIAGLGDGQPIEIVACPEEFGYRIRTQVHADPAVKRIGFYRRQSHDVIEARSCPILVEGLDQTIAGIREAFDWETLAGGPVNIEAAFAGGMASVFSEELIEPVENVRFRNGETEYGFNAAAFFQANEQMVGPLIEAATEGLSGGLAVDLYCGIGLFAIPLARNFERVVGVESSASSYNFAVANAAAAGLSNAEFVQSRVKNFIVEHTDLLADADLVIVDPPRSGVKGAALKLLAEAAPRRFNYVSCNPSTLARDVRLLIDAGYSIEKFSVLDLFPQTHHVESVVRLVREK